MQRRRPDSLHIFQDVSGILGDDTDDVERHYQQTTAPG